MLQVIELKHYTWYKHLKNTQAWQILLTEHLSTFLNSDFTQSKISQILLSLQAGPEADDYCRKTVLK